MKTGNLSERVKVDVAVLPKSLASTNETGAYFNLREFTKALFVFTAATIAATKTVVGQIMKATDGAGTGATALTGAAATITANAGVTKALLTAATIVDESSVVTINGVTYSCEDTTPSAAAGEFDSGADDTAACANLAAVINLLQGKDILATPSAGTVILTAKDPGKKTITITGAHSTIVPSTLEAIGFIEVDALDLGTGFTHAALKLTTDATIVVAGMVARSGGSTQAQQVAASKVQ